MRPESAFFTPHDSYPHPEWWSARDNEASEEEVGDFLYGLVRLMQPECVVETGCYLGDTSLRIAQALKDNRHGHLHTCDTDKERAEFVMQRLTGYPATVFVCSGESLIQSYPQAQLAFIESGGDRDREIALLHESLVVLHDARWYKEPGLFFSTPRGISVFKVNHGKTES